MHPIIPILEEATPGDLLLIQEIVNKLIIYFVRIEGYHVAPVVLLTRSFSLIERNKLEPLLNQVANLPLYPFLLKGGYGSAFSLTNGGD